MPSATLIGQKLLRVIFPKGSPSRFFEEGVVVAVSEEDAEYLSRIETGLAGRRRVAFRVEAKDPEPVLEPVRQQVPEPVAPVVEEKPAEPVGTVTLAEGGATVAAQ